MNKSELMKLLTNYNVEPASFHDYKKSNLEKVDLKDPSFQGFISESWVVGGTTGNNLWVKEDELLSAEPEKSFDILDSFLMNHCPSITLIQYKTLAAYINEQDYRVTEYYGNNSEMRLKYIRFNDLIKFIEKNKIEVVNKEKSLKMKK